MREHRIVVIDLNRRCCLAVVLRHKNSEQMKLTNALKLCADQNAFEYQFQTPSISKLMTFPTMLWQQYNFNDISTLSIV